MIRLSLNNRANKTQKGGNRANQSTAKPVPIAFVLQAVSHPNIEYHSTPLPSILGRLEQREPHPQAEFHHKLRLELGGKKGEREGALPNTSHIMLARQCKCACTTSVSEEAIQERGSIEHYMKSSACIAKSRNNVR